MSRSDNSRKGGKQYWIDRRAKESNFIVNTPLFDFGPLQNLS
jgi:hypothetical protein